MDDTIRFLSDELETTIQKIKAECYEKQLSQTEEFKSTIQLLTTEEWFSLDNTNFINQMNEFVNFANIIGQFYNNIAGDLEQFKSNLELEINKKEKVHYDV